MTEVQSELLHYSPVTHAVRIALLEIGFQWRAEQQYNAWLNRSKT